MALNGKPLGPTYSLGLITVAAAGTPVNLNQNVPTTVNIGAPGAAAQPPIVANKLIVTNVGPGYFYLVYKGATAAANNGIGVVLAVPPNASAELDSPNLNNPFSLGEYQADTDTGGTKAYITAVIL